MIITPDFLNKADVNILVSIVNLKLRNEFESLGSLCRYHDVSESQLLEALSKGGFQYDPQHQQFH